MVNVIRNPVIKWLLSSHKTEKQLLNIFLSY